jgi:hypothetical membrane protein
MAHGQGVGGRASAVRERLGGVSGVAGVGVFVASVAVLHFLQPELSPWDVAISDYVHGAYGWLLTLGLVAVGVGSLLLVVGLARGVHGRWASAGRLLVLLWALGQLLAGIFPTDSTRHWSEPPSFSGIVHGNAALLAFLALPAGALILLRSFRDDPRWQASARGLLALAVASLITLVLFGASLAPALVRHGLPVLLGLTERLMLAVYAAWLTVVGLGLMRHQSAGRR